MTEHYDVIIVGTGAGGGTLANVLGRAGKRILLLERGNFLPREKANWDPDQVFPSIGAVNPALTVMANALRVGEHLLERLS